jgi:hypothetical protein
MKHARACACSWSKNPDGDPPREAREVLGFFERLGLSARIEAIPLGLVWDSFGDFEVCYYDTFKVSIIDAYRSTDASFYVHLTWLDRKLKGHHRRRKPKEDRAATCVRVRDVDATLEAENDQVR